MKYRIGLLLLLLSLTLSDRALLVYQELRFADFGVRAKLVQGDLLIDQVPERDELGQPFPFFEVGVRVGDRLEGLFNLHGEGGAIHSIADYGDRLRIIPPGEGCVALINRLEPDGRESSLRLVVPAPPPRQRRRLSLLLSLGNRIDVPLLAALAATLIGLAKPRDNLAFLASLMFFAFSGIFLEGTYRYPTPLREVSLLFRSVTRSFTPYLVMVFFLLFPVASPIERRFPWIKKAALAPVVVFTVFGVARDLSAYLSFEAFGRVALATERVGVRFLQDYVELPLMVGMITLGVVSLAANTLSAQTRQERHRLQWLAFGTAAGLLPLFSVAMLNWLGVRQPSWLPVVVLPIVGLFPLSFIYVVLRHRVFGIRLIVRRGLRYALVSRGFIAFEGLAIFAALHFLVTPLLTTDAGIPSSIAPLGTALAALLLALGIRRVNRWVLPAIDRRFFRDVYDARRLLVDLTRAARRLVSRPERLLEVVAEQILHALHPRQVAIFLAEESFDALDNAPTLGLAPATSRPPEASGPAVDPVAPMLPTAGHGLNGGDAGQAAALRGFRLHLHRFEPTLRFAGGAAPIDPDEFGLLASPFPERESDLNGSPSEVLDIDPESPRVRRGRAVTVPISWMELRDTFDGRLVIPLATGPRLLGFITLASKLSEEPYSREDHELLLTVAEQVAVALDYARLARRAAEQDRMRREMEIAGHVQNQLLPQVFPKMRTLSYTGTCRPARGVGGDYFDFLKLDEHRLVIALGDISGKGVSAALLMASLQGALRAHAADHCEDLSGLVSDLNKLMCSSTGAGRFATLFLGVYDDRGRELCYVNAGHLPPIVARPGRNGDLSTVHRLAPSGMVIGVLDDTDYETRRIFLKPGDALVIFSDGLTEAEAHDGDMFDEERVVNLVQDNARLDESALQNLLLAKVDDFVGDAPQGDDITTIVAQVH